MRSSSFYFISVFVFLLFLSGLRGQEIDWQTCLGGADVDSGDDLCITSDKGYIIAGYTKSNDGDVTGNHGSYDYWLIKTDSSGSIDWQKCFGGSMNDWPNSIHITANAGYYISGYTKSTDGDVTGNHGSNDYWVIKTDSTGNIEWKSCYGGSGSDLATSSKATSDSGYIIAGYSDSNDGDVSGNHGLDDYWIVKTDSVGNIEWQKCYGGTQDDRAQSIVQTHDNGYLIAGYSGSDDGDVSGNNGNWDFWIVKIDSVGNLLWQECFGGSDYEVPVKAIQLPDSSFVITGYSKSNDGDVSGNHGDKDNWVIKISNNGNLIWQSCFGGTGGDFAYNIIQTIDSGFISCGYTYSNDGDVSGNHGSSDYWIVKMDQSGNLNWSECFGGTSYDIPQVIKQTPDTGYIIAGYSYSNNGNVSGNHGSADLWLVKLNKVLIADFSADTTYGDPPLNVQFSDSSYGANISWHWDFGDGNTSILQNPQHVYDSAGTYTVTLTISDGSDSNEKIIPSYIRVFDNHLINESFDHGMPYGWSQVIYNGSGLWQWNNDGIQNFTGTDGYYAAASEEIESTWYDVGLFTLAMDLSGQTSVNVEFDRDFQLGCSFAEADVSVYSGGTDVANLEEQLWYSSVDDPVNGVHTSLGFDPSQYSDPSEVYVRFYYNDDNPSCYQLFFKIDNVKIYKSRASFSADSTIGTYPFLVSFSDSSSSSPTTWHWDFGDGDTSNLQNPTHTYDSAGVYSVTLAISDGTFYDTLTKQDYIYVGTPFENCGDSLFDIRDTSYYQTVQIGNQCWFSDNLNIGKMIVGDSNQTDNDTIEKYCFNSIEDSCDVYGGLYQWDEVMQYTTDTAAQGLCPDNWHIPSDGEWKILEGTIDTQYGLGNPEWDGTGLRGYDAGKRLKSAKGWYNNGNGTNTFNFKALPGGHRNDNGAFYNGTAYGFWWSSTEIDDPDAYSRGIPYFTDEMGRYSDYKAHGFSIRCLNNNSWSTLNPDFSADTTIGTYDFTVSFADSSAGDPTTWHWNFGDGDTSNLQNPTHTYDSSGIYSVTLAISDGTFYDTLTKTDYIYVATPFENCGDSLFDIRDTSYYQTVQIDNQCWFKENLNIGSLINDNVDQTDNGIIEKYCYNDTEDSCDIYGGFYLWDEMMQYVSDSGAQGICPDGWHIPEYHKWIELINHLGGEDVAGGKMKETGTRYWQPNNVAATNESGFSALGSGYRWFFGTIGQGIWANFWSSTTSPNELYIQLSYEYSGVYYVDAVTTDGVSVRCINNNSWSTLNPDFSADTTIGTYDFTVNFADSSAGVPTTWHWNFGDGDTSNLQNPSHTYDSAGVYSVSLAISDGTFYDTLTKTDYIYVATPFENCGDSLFDIRDTSYYQTVQIGNQCWFAENLNIGKKIEGSIDQTDNDTIEKYCWINNDDKCNVYGGLYQWNEVMKYTTDNSDQGICPDNWYIPNNDDWNALISFLGGSSIAGGKMKEVGTNYWVSPNTGATNESGFSAYGGGFIYPGNSFLHLHSRGYWWSFTDTLSTNAYRVVLGFGYPNIFNYYDSKDKGFSVRCINNNPWSTLEANFSSDTTTGHAPFHIQLADSSDGSPTNWHWDFGDGDSSNLQNPGHTYDSAGLYTISLVISDGEFTDTLVRENYIKVVSSESLQDSLDHYYKFDGDLVDCINGINGVNNNTQDDPSGMINHSRYFTGEGNCYITTNNNEAFNYLHNGSDFTVSVWAKHNAAESGWRYIYGNGAGYDRRSSFFAVDTTSVRFIVGRTTPYPVVHHTWEGVLTADTSMWNHLVITHDASPDTNQYRLYVNGALAGMAYKQNDYQTGNADQEMKFGINKLAGTKKPFKGELDELVFWNRKLEPYEVEALYNNNMGIQYPFVPSNMNIYDVVVAAAEIACFDALNVLTVAGSGTTVLIEDGAEASFIAGNKIVFKPGFTAESGSYAHAYISTTNNFCNNQQTMASNPDILTIEEPAGIMQKEDHVLIYPNPGTGRYTVDFMGEEFSGKLTVINFQGNILLDRSLQNAVKEVLNIGHLPDGIYFIKISDKSKVITRKIIKQ